MAATPLRKCVACAKEAAKMAKCRECFVVLDARFYYCDKVCQGQMWPKHKVAHTIGELLRAISDAAGGDKLEQNLRKLDEFIKEKQPWKDESFWLEETDRMYIKQVHLEMLWNISTAASSQTEQVRRAAAAAMISLLALSDRCFNIGIHNDAVAFAQWHNDGMRYILNPRGTDSTKTEDSNPQQDTMRVWPIPKSYRGRFLRENWHGICQFDYNNGSRYSGQWRAGHRHGYGAFFFGNGGSYMGQWVNGVEHGRGTLTEADGDRYEGDFANGKRHGHGTLTRANGDCYEGQFQNGQVHGQGKLMLAADLGSYEGEFVDGRPDGVGDLTFTLSLDEI